MSTTELQDGEQLLSTDEVAQMLGVSTRMVRALPIKQFKLGARTIRFRVSDVYDYLGIDDPNA